jgi:DNA-binding transcriptional MerR regulator
MSMSEMFKAQEFASLAGVTVRTLHHYDRLGLLKPRARTESGYRLYRENDLMVLEQITVLKFLGLPLKRIREVMAGKTGALKPALQLQLWALAEKRRRLDLAMQAIREAQQILESGQEPDGRAFQKILEVMEMEKNTDWMMKYYDEESRAKVEDRKRLWSPELQERVSKQWADLFADIAAAKDEDPTSLKAQALADRWNALVGEFTGGDPGIAQGLRAMYSDQQNWPQGNPSPVPNDATAFIMKVNAARKK